MKQEELEFMGFILENSRLLLYGEFEQYLNSFLKKIFQKEFSDIGFNDLDDTFGTAYWFLLSWLDMNNLFEYGTSPRGGWLTENGEKFKEIIMKYENAIDETTDWINKKYN